MKGSTIFSSGIAAIALSGCTFSRVNVQRSIDIQDINDNPKKYASQWYAKEFDILGMMKGPEHQVPVSGYLRFIGEGKIPDIPFSNTKCHLYRIYAENKEGASLPVIVLLFNPANGEEVKRGALVSPSESFLTKNVSFNADFYQIPPSFNPSKLGIKSEEKSNDKFVLWLDPAKKESKFELEDK